MKTLFFPIFLYLICKVITDLELQPNIRKIENSTESQDFSPTPLPHLQKIVLMCNDALFVPILQFVPQQISLIHNGYYQMGIIGTSKRAYTQTFFFFPLMHKINIVRVQVHSNNSYYKTNRKRKASHQFKPV